MTAGLARGGSHEGARTRGLARGGSLEGGSQRASRKRPDYLSSRTIDLIDIRHIRELSIADSKLERSSRLFVMHENNLRHVKSVMKIMTPT